MKNLSLFLVFLFLFLPTLACSSVTSIMHGAHNAKEKSEFRQSYDLAPTGTLSLNNVNGSVNIRVWDEPRVEVKAVKSGPTQEKLELVKIEVTSKPDHVSIDTVYPKTELNLNVSVAYEVTVPRNASLNKIETVNGSIEITGVQGRIETETTNGSITISGSKAGIDAESVNGSIKATLPELPSGEQVKMETVNGSLTLNLPDTLNADIDAETTNGRIISDFSLSAQEGKENKHIKGKIGSGGSQLKLETTNGSINIARIKS